MMGLNSSSRYNSKFCISSSGLPVGAPEALNNHAQPEQAQPWKRGSSTHTIWRRIAALYETGSDEEHYSSTRGVNDFRPACTDTKCVADILERDLNITIREWMGLVEKVPDLASIHYGYYVGISTGSPSRFPRSCAAIPVSAWLFCIAPARNRPAAVSNLPG